MDAIPPEPSRTVAPGLGVSNRIMPTIRERLQGTAGRRAFIVVLLVLGILFPLIDGNEGDIDAAANALAFAILALGLNIVVGFAGLLDLGYAAFFAIGAYTYGIFSSYQVQPEWWGFWEPFQWLGLVQHVHPASGSRHGAFHGIVLADAAGLGAHRRFLRRAVRRADLAPEGRLPRHRDASASARSCRSWRATRLI